MMAVQSDLDPIEFLLRRRFGPGLGEVRKVPPGLNSGKISLYIKDLDEKQKEREAYEKELRELAPEELNERVRTAIEEDAATREANFSFNRSKAKADSATYDHWAKAAYWEVDEAVALLIERKPDQLEWKYIRPVISISHVAARFAQLRDLVLRAQTVKQLAVRMTPALLVAWAKRNHVDVPPDMEDAVRRYGQQVIDWKTAHDEQKARAEAAEAALSELRQQVEQLAEKSAEKSLSTRERESLLKLVIGMAVACYRHDPNATRTSTASAIAGDLHTLGISIDKDTVRKWLHEAAEVLPPAETE